MQFVGHFPSETAVDRLAKRRGPQFEKHWQTILSTPAAHNACLTKLNWLMLLKEIISVYGENHEKPTNTQLII
jgi:hypothetical protein